jgi:cytochrome c oxidase assembly protein subunit 15
VGGLRVLLEHQRVNMIDTSVGRLFAMLHACLAQIFVCTLAAIAAACSRPWLEPKPSASSQISHAMRRLGVICCALLVAQLGIAAVMRHSFAGLAIPTFPQSAADGSWLPQAWDFRVGIHFAHRVMALGLTVAIVMFAAKLLRTEKLARGFKVGSLGLLSLLVLQIYLGAVVVLSGRKPELTTAHVIVGAATLTLTFLITWFLHRDVIEAGSITSQVSPQSLPSTRALSHA